MDACPLNLLHLDFAGCVHVCAEQPSVLLFILHLCFALIMRFSNFLSASGLASFTPIFQTVARVKCPTQRHLPKTFPGRLCTYPCGSVRPEHRGKDAPGSQEGEASRTPTLKNSMDF